MTQTFQIEELPARVVSEQELETWQPIGSLDELTVGDRVGVFSRGRTREGLVEKIGRTKATIVYTTQGALDDAVKIAGFQTLERSEAEAVRYREVEREYRELADGKEDDERIRRGSYEMTAKRSRKYAEDMAEKAAQHERVVELIRSGRRSELWLEFVTVTRKSAAPEHLFRPAA